MKIGIGLPTTIPGVRGHEVVDWARRAEAAGFSSLGTIDRIVYRNDEPLVALGFAAATERIELVTSIAILPYRQNAALVAKQAATIHDFSGGRFVFGVAVGGRPRRLRGQRRPHGGPRQGHGGDARRDQAALGR